MAAPTPSYYVSITGLRLKAPWHAPRFWYHAVRSMGQAKAAPGNIVTMARKIEGVHHTCSVWVDRQAMVAFLRSGAHAQAMTVFPAIATGKIAGLAMGHIPDWDEVRRIWEERGREA